MPIDYKNIIKKIASKVAPVDIETRAVQGDITSRLQNPLDKAKSGAAQIGTDLAYSELTKKQVQDVEAKEVGKEMAKNMGYGETGQMLAGALAQYGPSVLGMVRPAPKMNAVQRAGKGVKLVNGPALTSGSLGKTVVKDIQPELVIKHQKDRAVASAVQGTLNKRGGQILVEASTHLEKNKDKMSKISKLK